MAGFGFWPVAVQPLGRVACATLLWRASRRLHVTVVVKATFEIVPDGVMKQVEPEPVQPEQGELAPYLSHTDVVVTTGHAYACPPTPVTAVAVRLAVVREWPLLDKRLLVYGEDPRLGAPRATFTKACVVTTDGPVSRPGVLLDPSDPDVAAGFGLLAVDHPRRLSLLGKEDPPLPLGGVMDLPDNFAWEYFQRAPMDQRVAYLRGDEWLLLDGLHPELPRVKSRFPGAHAEVRVYPPSGQAAEGPTFHVAMQADRVNIDADALRCSVLWRGSFPVADERSARALTLLCALAMPGEPSALPHVGQPIRSPLAMAQAAAQPIVDEPTAESVPEPPADAADQTTRMKRRAAAAVVVDEPSAAPPPAGDASAATAAGVQTLVRESAPPADDVAPAGASPPGPTGVDTLVRESALPLVEVEAPTPSGEAPAPSGEAPASGAEAPASGAEAPASGAEAPAPSTDSPVPVGQQGPVNEVMPATVRIGTGPPLAGKLRSPAPDRFDEPSGPPGRAKKTIPYYSPGPGEIRPMRQEAGSVEPRHADAADGSPATTWHDGHGQPSGAVSAPGGAAPPRGAADEAPSLAALEGQRDEGDLSGDVTLMRDGTEREPQTMAFRQRTATDLESSDVRRGGAARQIVPSKAELPMYLPSEAKRWARIAEPSDPPSAGGAEPATEARPSALELTAEGAVSVRFLDGEQLPAVDDADEEVITAVGALNAADAAAAAAHTTRRADSVASRPLPLRRTGKDAPASEAPASWDDAKAFAATSHLLRPQPIPGAPWSNASSAEEKIGAAGHPPAASGPRRVGAPGQADEPEGEDELEDGPITQAVPPSGQASMEPSNLPLLSVEELENTLTETLSVRDGDVELIDEGDGD